MADEVANMSESELSEHAKKSRLKDTEFRSTSSAISEIFNLKCPSPNSISISDDGDVDFIHTEISDRVPSIKYLTKEEESEYLELISFKINYIREHGIEAFEKWLNETQ
jgi:hypothetical protein